jgi:AraC-like DNA-binding protein
LDIHVFDNAIHFDKAKYYYKKKAYQTALLHLDSILSTDTQSGFSYSYKDEVENLYARILKDMGKTEEALEKTLALNRMMQEQNRHRILVDKILRDRYDYRVIKAKIKHLETRILAESQTNRWLLLGIIISSGLILILIYRRKLLKDGYEITLTDLRNKQEKLEEEIEKSKQKILKSAQNQAGIESKTSKPRQLPSEKILRGMIERLKDFENKKEYLKPEVDLGYLAKYLKSNKTYTSLVVKEYSGMSFKDYINKLRIEYSIHLMYNDIDYVSNLNIEGMAVEVGYTTSKPYRMAFKKFTGSHPSYFIKQVKKSKKN